MRAVCLGIAAVLLAGLTTAYGADKKDEVKAKLVGVWQPSKDDKAPSVEFTKDGKLKIVIDMDGKKVTIDGTYEVDGENVKVVMKDPEGKEHKDTLKITKLTDKELVTEDSKGMKDEFKKAEKKDKDK